MERLSRITHQMTAASASPALPPFRSHRQWVGVARRASSPLRPSRAFPTGFITPIVAHVATAGATKRPGYPWSPAIARTGDIGVYLPGSDGHIAAAHRQPSRRASDGQLMAVHYKEGQRVKQGRPDSSTSIRGRFQYSGAGAGTTHQRSGGLDRMRGRTWSATRRSSRARRRTAGTQTQLATVAGGRRGRSRQIRRTSTAPTSTSPTLTSSPRSPVRVGLRLVDSRQNGSGPAPRRRSRSSPETQPISVHLHDPGAAGPTDVRADLAAGRRLTVDALSRDLASHSRRR